MTSFYILNNRTRKKELESCDGLGNIDGKVSFLRGFFCKQLFSMAESIDSKITLWLFLRKNEAYCSCHIISTQLCREVQGGNEYDNSFRFTVVF